MTDNILVVAFDGLDKGLIEGYGLENVRQEEYGAIDNQSGIWSVKTPELFASFLTGETHEVHGVKGFSQWDNELVNNFEKFNENYWFFRKFNGLRSFVYNFLGVKDIGYVSDDYEVLTLFDKIGNSFSLDIPGYEATLDKGNGALENWGINEAVKIQDQVFDLKRKKLYELIDQENFDFLMAHFHKSDHYHHWFWEIGDEETVEEMYHEMDEVAGEIIEKAEDKFDYIIFMSDHGLPTEKSHNENAFYSCNRELFGDKTPHITDFHDKIMDITEADNQDRELEGIDI